MDQLALFKLILWPVSIIPISFHKVSFDLVTFSPIDYFNTLEHHILGSSAHIHFQRIWSFQSHHPSTGTLLSIPH